jgi:mannosylglycoprotein endo-beta-mannosidase
MSVTAIFITQDETMRNLRSLLLVFLISSTYVLAQDEGVNVGVWQMQDVAKVSAEPAAVSRKKFSTASWYRATVPGTVLTTLVDNKVYPEPLYGENMRAIPESLNRTSYWYRTTLNIPANYKGRRTWLHFAGINYSAQIWIDGQQVGTIRGAFLRGDFDVTSYVRPGKSGTLAVLVAPQPHPGTPHEHTVALGTGRNGGETALDGPTFLSTVGWDWQMAVRDRDTGIWLPVTLSSTGPVDLRNPVITSELSARHDSADLHVSTTLVNATGSRVSGMVSGTISGQGSNISFRKAVTIPASASLDVTFDPTSAPDLHILSPKLWWPNGYGAPDLYKLTVRFDADNKESDSQTLNFGIRKIEYEVTDSPNLTLVVNGVKVMVRGGNWGLDESMKRLPRERLDAQFHMHALANLNMIRNWVGQSTSPDFYNMADKYGILLWDEFFQPNPSDGPDVADIATYFANVTDKVLRYRNHPSIAVWCARNEGNPPKKLDEALAAQMAKLDPTRLYQSSSTEGRGVSSHGPYYWRSPRFFYQINEAFKTETGSVSIPTIESIQGMMPNKDWETINDDWAQHDMAAGAQRGDEYPSTLARRYGPIRNLADFVRKGQLANYEAYRAMYESRNASMFTNSTGVITWMSHPSQPSFVWQLYHYDLEPNSALFATKKAAEPVHIQFNEADRDVEVVNNLPHSLQGLSVTQTIFRFDGTVDKRTSSLAGDVSASSTKKLYVIWVNPHISEIYFIKLDLKDAAGTLLSTNLYWQNIASDDYTSLMKLPTVALQVHADARISDDQTVLDVVVTNPSLHVALLAHLQLHEQLNGTRVLPAFYSDNYLSLAPGETRTLTIQASSHAIIGGPLLLIDGYNVTVGSSGGSVPIKLNENAQPMHWPASDIVPSPTFADAMK